MKMRNGSIEAFRCLCMFGIVFLHAVTWSPFVVRGMDNVGNVGVVGFVMVSAFFGIQFKPSKIVRLLTVAVASSIAAYATIMAFSGDCSGGGFCTTVWQFTCSCWYVWAYLFLMLVSPLVDTCLEKVGKDRKSLSHLLICSGFLLWVWNYSATVSHFKWVPTTVGFDELSGVTLVGVYACARLMFALRVGGGGWLLAALSGCLVYAGFRHSAGIVAFVFAWSVFGLFLKFRLPEWMNKTFRWLGGSMFAVYMIHAQMTELFFECERGMFESWGLSYNWCHLIMATAAFFGCVVIDLPRRFVAHLFKRPLKAGCALVDDGYYRLVARLAG